MNKDESATPMPEELEVMMKQARKMLEAYVRRSPYTLNPDPEVVDQIVAGLVHNRQKHGYFYCPCRLVTGDREKDRASICPCRFHKDEILQQGACHCGLFVDEHFQASDR